MARRPPAAPVFERLFRLNRGPKCRKLDVLRTWMPARCSPLNGVAVLGQPAFFASSGELNQRPR